MGVHDGHRQRRLASFLQNGFESMHPHEVLEILLFYAIPRRDTNPIAHQLLDSFGSLSAVFDAPYEELLKVDGVGPNAAALLKMVPQLAQVYLSDVHSTEVINSKEDLARALLPRFVGRKQETVYLLCLDNKRKVTACILIGEGSVNSSAINLRRVLEQAVRHNAASIVLAHNHPGGIALPSSEDLATTHALIRLCDTIGVPLLDHLIVADGDYVSLAESGILGRQR